MTDDRLVCSRAREAACGGFTLVELLVVLAVMGMAMAAAPSLMASLPGARVRAATDGMAATLRNLHDQAMSGGTPAELTLDPGRRTYALSTGGGPRAFPPVIDAVAFEGGVKTRPGQLGKIRFFPDGSATGGTMLLRGRGREYGLVIDWMTGRVRRE